MEEPKHKLDEKEMENILYDLSLLQAINSTHPQKLDSNKVDVHSYVYKKYKIDSATFAQNHKYYASDLEKYKTIHTKVLERLKSQKAPLDSLEKKEGKIISGKAGRTKGLIPSAKK